MSRTRVRAHTRRVEGQTITVRRHYRDLNSLLPARRGAAVVKARRGTRNLRQALRYVRRDRPAAAAVFAAAGAGEIVAWVSLRGLSVLAATVAILAAALAGLAFLASRAEQPAPGARSRGRQVVTGARTAPRAAGTRMPTQGRRVQTGRRR